MYRQAAGNHRQEHEKERSYGHEHVIARAAWQQDELLYILEGTYRVKIGEHVFTASVGTFIHIPGGVSHTWDSLTTGRMLVTFLPGGLRGFYDQMRPLYLAPQVDMQAFTALAARYGLVVTGPHLTE